MRIAVHVLTLVTLSGQASLAAPAIPHPCGPLKQVASLEMTMLPDGSRASIPLSIDGKLFHLLVDTGSGMSTLTRSAGATLKLWPRDSEAMHLVDKDGAIIHHYYVADSFQLGNLAAKRIIFMQDGGDGEGDVSGAFGPDLMLRYDIEMDFAQQRLNLFSQDHCPGHIVYWHGDAVTQVPIRITARAKDFPPSLPAGGLGGLPSEFVELETSLRSPILGTDIRTQVMLDGHVFTANIDTGLEVSTINSLAARGYYDVPLEDHPPHAPASRPDQPVQATPGTETVTVTGFRDQHRFHSLTFGGVKVINPLFVLTPAPADARKVGAAESPDITIGMNVLRKLHLYFAFGERMLYVSAAGSQAEPQR